MTCACALNLKTIARGDLVAVPDFHAVFWRGEKLPLQKAQAEILALLMRRPMVSTLALTALGDTGTPNAVKVQICNMRRMLPQGVWIDTLHGFGYQLRVTGTAALRVSVGA